LFWVIATFCGVVIYLVIDRYRTHQAISWWQDRQIERLHQETELIRDRILQDLFSLRRHLGVVIGKPKENLNLEQTLAIADCCHEHLVQLSDRLFSPYAAENLGIAMQELVERWRKVYPDSTFAYANEASTDVASQQNYQFLLIWLDELCRLVSDQQNPIDLAIKLNQSDDGFTIELRVQTALVEPSFIAQLRYLSRIFRTLQRGGCQWQRDGDQWVFKLKCP
jgi:hypothetical protein